MSHSQAPFTRLLLTMLISIIYRGTATDQYQKVKLCLVKLLLQVPSLKSLEWVFDMAESENKAGIISDRPASSSSTVLACSSTNGDIR